LELGLQVASLLSGIHRLHRRSGSDVRRGILPKHPV